jgi:uncharacterized membrane protein YfcA
MSLLLLAGACLVTGSMIGFLGGLLGIGGGLIAIPVLALVLGMPQQLAQGTALVLVLPTVMLSVRKYYQHARFDLRVVFAGALVTVLFTWVGARLALGIDPRILRLSFAGFLLCIALFYVVQARRKRRPVAAAMTDQAAPVFTPAKAAVLSVATGTLGGFFSVGGAVLAVPVITTFYRLPQTTAQALALSTVIPGSAIALATYAWAGQTDWHVGLPLAIGSLLFVAAGVRLAHRLAEWKLRAAFAGMLFATVILLVIESR